MAWEATCLLPPVLLVLLASGSWGQKPEMLHLLEGDSFSVKCLYPPQKGSEAVKFWCKWDLSRTCTLLATSPQLWGKPQNSIEDKVGRGYFIVTMTKLRVEDSGSYSCGIYKSSRKFFHRNIHLVVSRASILPTARNTSGTTAWTSATSPVTDRYSVPIFPALHVLLPMASCGKFPPAATSPPLSGSQGMKWESHHLHQVALPL